jgi:hypothetical protein
MSKFMTSKLNEEKLTNKIREILGCGYNDVSIKKAFGHACSFDVNIPNLVIGLMSSQIMNLFKELGDYDMMIIPERNGVLRFIADVNNKEYHVQNS